MLPPTESQAERLLERASREPEFEAKLRAAYRGRHDVLDALWWAAHPLTDSPPGLPDPATELKALQRAAFSRAATGSPTIAVADPVSGETVRMSETEHRLHEAQRRIADDARQLADALATLEAESEPDEPAVNLETVTEDAAARSPRRFLLPVLSGAILLGAILVLPALSQLGSDDQADADSEPGATSQPIERAEIVTLGSRVQVDDPAAVLDRSQEPGDRPDTELRFRAETYRALPEVVPHAELYLARGNQTDSICLVVNRQDGQTSSTCTPKAGFSDPALKVGGGRYRVSPQMTILTESFAISPDGELVYEATARVIGDAAFGIGPSAGQTETVTFVSEGNVGDPIAILDRPMTEEDQPGPDFASNFTPDSFRALPDLVGFLDLYLARGEDGDSVCLIVEHEDGSGGASCSPESLFLEHGLEFGGSGRHPISRDTTILSETLTLLPNGDFRYDATALAPVGGAGSRMGELVEGG